MKTFIFILAGAVLAAVGTAFLWRCEDDWCFVLEWQKVRAADSFERCQSLSFPVMESYPRQCRAGDKTFTEEIRSFEYKNLVRIFSPLHGAVISSPVTVRGQARGNWFFEASFPVKLFDANGNAIQFDPPYIMTSAEWTTADFVPFEAALSFKAPAAETGVLVFEKDNPSGLPENTDSFSIPVRFR